MSFMPAFELGVWNAWIFVVPLIVYWVAGIKFLFSPRMPEYSSFERRKDKIFSQMLIVILFASYFYSVFVPFKLGTMWFYIGVLVYLVGMVFITLSIIDFANTPTTQPVTKGLYRYSRNPMFIGFFLTYFGLTIACVSWVYLVISILFMLIVNYLSPLEEFATLKTYGKTYEDYMKRTPKWIGIPKPKGKQ